MTDHYHDILSLLERLDDPSAQEKFLDFVCQRFRWLVHTMLAHYPHLRRWEETDDVLQISVLRLYQSLSEVRPDSMQQLVGLAATQIRRTLIDLLRHHFGPAGHAAHHHSDDGESGSLITNTSSRDDEPSTLEEWAIFHEAVERLPEREQAVVNLLWYEGLTQSEAASLLEIDVRSVKRRWRSAKQMLARQLRQDTSGF